MAKAVGRALQARTPSADIARGSDAKHPTEEPVSNQTTTYYMLGHLNEGVEIPDPITVAPGLVVFRLPNSHKPNNPRRWRIGHHSGNSLADAMRHEDAIKGAELAATLHDWTQDVETLRSTVDAHQLFVKLGAVDCIEPNSERAFRDVSSNGTYTDADIEAAAAEYKADGYSAFEILYDMAHRVPWKGLDTEPFNEAHDRIVRVAGAA
jgi:hypothetical protein